MKYKLIKRLYNFWSKVNPNDGSIKLSKSLLKNIKYQVNICGIKGAETLLDWCHMDFDNITKDNDNYEELIKIWDICNWYLDYLNGSFSKKELIDKIENY